MGIETNRGIAPRGVGIERTVAGSDVNIAEVVCDWSAAAHPDAARTAKFAIAWNVRAGIENAYLGKRAGVIGEQPSGATGREAKDNGVVDEEQRITLDAAGAKRHRSAGLRLHRCRDYDWAVRALLPGHDVERMQAEE